MPDGGTPSRRGGGGSATIPKKDCEFPRSRTECCNAGMYGEMMWVVAPANGMVRCSVCNPRAISDSIPITLT